MTQRDADLVQGSLRGDREAFAGLLRRYRDAVYGLAYHRIGDFAVAEDLTQEAFVQAYLRLGELREPGKFAPWLLAVARNLCNQHLRSRHPEGDESPAELSTDGLERRAAARDLVHRALSGLPPDNGLAITLYYVNGYNYAEVASFLEVPKTTVKGRIERGRRQLREEMMAMVEAQFEEHKPGEELDETVIRRISAAEVWKLSPEDQGKQLECNLLLIDGHLAEPRVTGMTGGGSTSLEASVALFPVGDEPLCVCQVLGQWNRYYVFGKGKVMPDGPVVENQVLETSVTVRGIDVEETRAGAAGLPEVFSAQVVAMRPCDRDEFFRELRPNSHILLDGGPAEGALINGPPDSATATPGREVRFGNVGTSNLHIYRWEWPKAKYFVFGEAEVTPPGIRVEDSIVVLEARLAQA